MTPNDIVMYSQISTLLSHHPSTQSPGNHAEQQTERVYKIQSGIEAIRRTRPSESIKAHMDSERLKHQAQGLLSLQEVLCIYIIASSFRFLRDP